MPDRVVAEHFRETRNSDSTERLRTNLPLPRGIDPLDVVHRRDVKRVADPEERANRWRLQAAEWLHRNLSLTTIRKTW
jgi:hypothetical protein